jgi:hypothetical protein
VPKPDRLIVGAYVKTERVILSATDFFRKKMGLLMHALFNRGLIRGSTSFSASSERATEAVEEIFRRTAVVSGKTVRLMHSGHLQWYLIFGICVGIAIFARFIGG